MSLGYKREDTQDSLMGHKYNEVMSTHLFLSYKKVELEDYTITLSLPQQNLWYGMTPAIARARKGH